MSGELTTAQKLWRMLGADQRRGVVLLLSLMLIGMVLEMLGIGFVIPALALITEKDVVTRYPILAPLLTHLGNPTQAQLVVVGMLALVGIYVFKALFLTGLAWRQMKFVYALQADLSQRLFVGYLRQPYTFHLQRNSAQLIRNVVNDTNLFTHRTVQAAMLLVTEMLVLLGVTALLLAVEPLGTLLVVSTFGVAAWCLNWFTRDRILRWGELRQKHEGLRIQHVQQGLGGVKDVILLGREDDFFAQFRHHNALLAGAGQRQSTMELLPRLWFEMLAVMALAAFVLTVVWQGKPLEVLLPTLGLFGAAALRLMPSINRIVGAIQSMRFCLPVIDTLHHEVHLLGSRPVERERKPLPFKNSLVLNEVTFCYPGSEVDAVSRITLSIQHGASVGFIGDSGAGKSTLVDLILGLLAPTKGSISVDGIDIRDNLRSWQDQIGYVPQTIFLSDDTLRRNVAFGLRPDQIDEVAVAHAIRAAQLEHFVRELPQGLDTVVGERGVRLSGGQRQRIGIARALYHNPPVVVFDEATSSLDIGTEADLMETVQALRGNKTLIIVAHRPSAVEQCDRLFRLKQGRVVEEGATAVMLKSFAMT